MNTKHTTVDPDDNQRAQIVNCYPDLLEAAKIGLACCLAWGGKCAAQGEKILARESEIQAETIRAAIEKATLSKLKLSNGMDYGLDSNGNKVCRGARMGRANKLPDTMTQSKHNAEYATRLQLLDDTELLIERQKALDKYNAAKEGNSPVMEAGLYFDLEAVISEMERRRQ